MTWTLTELAAIAEIVGVIAIVPSLIFVGVQIQRSNRETRAATVQAASNSELYLGATFADHAETWEKVLAGVPLTEGEERRKGIILYNMIMTESENRYHQFSSGFLEASSWEGRLASVRALVRAPLFETWRNSVGALVHSSDFLDLVDELAKELRTDD